MTSPCFEAAPFFENGLIERAEGQSGQRTGHCRVSPACTVYALLLAVAAGALSPSLSWMVPFAPRVARLWPSA